MVFFYREDDSRYQRQPNPLASSLRTIIRWHSFWDPRVLMNPVRLIVQRYNGFLMNAYIRQRLESRFRELKEGHADGKTSRIKSVATLALEAYIAEQQNSELLSRDRLDNTFADYATWQIRVFLFAGADTTASTLVYIICYPSIPVGYRSSGRSTSTSSGRLLPKPLNC